MKATGIVRRIDELGRVVIPKEIRRTLRIREGDPLEIYTDRDGEVILKKYSPIGELTASARELAEALCQASGHTAVICDKDGIIAAGGALRRELADKPVSREVEDVMHKRGKVLFFGAGQGKPVPVTRDDSADGYTAQIVIPIIAAGDAIGAVMLLSREELAAMGHCEHKLCEAGALFLAKQLED